MSRHELKRPDIGENERYLEKLNQCQQIVSDLGPMVALGYGYGRFFSDGLYWSRDLAKGDWLPPVGDWDSVDWPAAMEGNMPDGAEISCVPEYLLKLWQETIPDRIEIAESRDQWDYILYPDRIDRMEGRIFKSFRQAAHKFINSYPTAQAVPIGEGALPELLVFHEKAERELQERVENPSEARAEDEAIRRILGHWADPRSHLFGYLIRVDGRIASVIVNERINEFSSIGIYQKNDYTYAGINAFATLTDARLQKEMGVITINVMQDEGVENLRNAKEHLSPLVYIRKYTVVYHASDPTGEGQSWRKGVLRLVREAEGSECRFLVYGRVMSDNVDLLEEKLLEACRGEQKILLDLSELEYICSAGLRVLLSVFKKKGAEGFLISGTSGYVKEILEMVGYDQILPMADAPRAPWAPGSMNTIPCVCSSRFFM
ncbi:MAG: STAS domain-containing protein [Lachnospiraceae bacterium]|nr:STAS domain-containing protein [Lachnospiraceae bacterium]